MTVFIISNVDEYYRQLHKLVDKANILLQYEDVGRTLLSDIQMETLTDDMVHHMATVRKLSGLMEDIT